MGVLNVIVVTAMLATQAAELPPPFPRPGTTKLLENDAVAVWDVSWLKQKYPLHTHRYDLVGISYAEGDRIITQGDAPGRLVPTKAWVFQTNRAGVTHVEEGASDPPMRAVLIEVKSRRAARTPRGTGGWSAPGRRRPCLGEQPRGGLARDRRLVGADASPRRRRGRADLRRHPRPKATFVPAGTVHAGPAPATALAPTSSRSSRRDHEAEHHRPAHLPDDVRAGRRCRRTTPRRVWTGCRQREAGVGSRPRCALPI